MARKRKGQPLHGWLVLDKTEGMTSTQALSRARRILDAEKAGHGGTLDPIATGVLPIAFGEATKTVAYVMDGVKTYHFTLCWGEQRTTDDREGAVIATSAVRPSRAAIEAALPAFHGDVTQVPPQYSAIKVEGERAYDLAREGEVVELAPRLVWIERFALLNQPDADHATFEVICGKGTYMRALARDLALTLGTVAHVTALRRLAVGQFTLANAISLDDLAALEHGAAAERLLPVATALADIPALALTDAEAHRLKLGQALTFMSRPDVARLDMLYPVLESDDPVALATCRGAPIALVRVDGVTVQPIRVLNL